MPKRFFVFLSLTRHPRRFRTRRFRTRRILIVFILIVDLREQHPRGSRRDVLDVALLHHRRPILFLDSIARALRRRLAFAFVSAFAFVARRLRLRLRPRLRA